MNEHSTTQENYARRWIDRYPCFRKAEYSTDKCYACFVRTECHNSLYRELDRLKAEVQGLRELCQRQDQEIQNLLASTDARKQSRAQLEIQEAAIEKLSDIKKVQQ